MDLISLDPNEIHKVSLSIDKYSLHVNPPAAILVLKRMFLAWILHLSL
jgi:hypothetical protein